MGHYSLLVERCELKPALFAGLAAVFDVSKGHDRAQVLVEMLCKVQQVVLDSDQLAKHSE